MNRRKIKMLASLIMALIMVIGAPLGAFAAQTTLSKSTEDNKIFYNVGDEVKFILEITNNGTTYSNIYDNIIDYFFTDAILAEVWGDLDKNGTLDLMVPGEDYEIDGNNIILRDAQNTLTLEPGASSYREILYEVQPEDFGKKLSNRLVADGVNDLGDDQYAEVTKHIHSVGLRITLTPEEATNEVNDTHTVTAHVEVNWAGYAGSPLTAADDHPLEADGVTGVWEDAPAGTQVQFYLSGPGSFDEDDGIPDDGLVTVGANGLATIDIVSSVTGLTKIGAMTEYLFEAFKLSSGQPSAPSLMAYASTDPYGTEIGSASGNEVLKHWVDAYITIEDDGVNLVGDTHTFTATLMVDYGESQAPNFVPAPAGTEITFGLTGPGEFDEDYDIPDDGIVAIVGTEGKATIDLNSSVTGTSFVSASAELTIDETTLNVTTDGIAPNSDKAVKRWINPSIEIVKTVDFNADGKFNDEETYYPGEPADYRYAVTLGAGSTDPLDNVSVADDQTGVVPVYESGDDGDEILEAGETWIFMAKGIIIDEEVLNTGTATGYDELDNKYTDTDTAKVLLLHPDINIEKTVDFDGDGIFTELEQNYPGMTADYKYVVTLGTSDVPISNVVVVDDQAGVIPVYVSGDDGDGILEAGETWIFMANDIVINSDILNTGTVTGEDPLGGPVTDSDTAAVKVLAEFEGLTPGFWKNHTEDWVVYSTSQTLEDVFDVPDALGLDSKTLLEALNFGGGKGDVGAAQNLFRAAVAALLNAADPEINYEFETAEIIEWVNEALTMGRAAMLELAAQLDMANNAGVMD